MTPLLFITAFIEKNKYTDANGSRESTSIHGGLIIHLLNKHTNVNGSRESTNRWPAMMVIPFWQPTIV